MIKESGKYFKDQINAVNDYEKTQIDLQNKQTDFAIDEIEREREYAKKDYLKEQSGAYVDWQKQSNPYGANAEKQAAVGLAGSGYSESSQVAMYNQYQQRVATAREVYMRADQNFAIAIKDAQLQNSAALAEIAFNTLKASLEAGLNGLMMKNQLLGDKISTKMAVQSHYWDKYSTTLNQINHENSMAEQVRQFNESQALERDKLKLQKDQFAWQKSQAKTSSSGGSSGTKSKKSSKKSSKTKKNNYDVKNSDGSVKTVDYPVVVANEKNTADAKAYLNELIKSGASKDKVSNEIAIALREKEITKEEAAHLRNTFTPRGVQY
jgi:hypothetical protein